MALSSPLATLPGPSPMPLFGWRGNMVRFFLDPLAYMDSMRASFGNVVPLVRGGGGPIMLQAREAQGTVFAFGPECSALLAAREEDGGRLTEDELIGQLFVLFLAGHDTTRSALSWTLFLLSQYPRIMEALGDELEGTLRGEPPSVEHLGRLPLLERVLKESLRLFTPAPFILRLTAAPVELAGSPLPAGTEVVLSFYHTHRLPELYPEPLRFRPERWEDFSPSPFEYVPFGGGARMCIGAGFATMEMKIILAMLLQRFRVELAPGARIDRQVQIVLSPKHGLPMRLLSREQVAGRSPTPVRGDVHQMIELPNAAHGRS